MTKADLISTITEMLDRCALTLMYCDVNVETYRQDFSERTVAQLKEGYTWFKTRIPVIEEYNKVRALRSEEIWSFYEKIDSEDLREVAMLRDVTRKVKKTFIGRPAVFRKAKDAHKCKGSSESSTRVE